MIRHTEGHAMVQKWITVESLFPLTSYLPWEITLEIFRKENSDIGEKMKSQACHFEKKITGFRLGFLQQEEEEQIKGRKVFLPARITQLIKALRWFAKKVLNDGL